MYCISIYLVNSVKEIEQERMCFKKLEPSINKQLVSMTEAKIQFIARKVLVVYT